jgi:hypothetical protein
MKPLLVALPLLALLAACSQHGAPSEQVEAAADEIVDAAQGVAPEGQPVLARYEPRDECSGLEGADDFLGKLKAAVAARDIDAFVALAAEDIKLDFGGGEGANELRKRLQVEKSSLWTELDELLALGCAHDKQGGMTIPWYFAQDMDADPFQAMIVTGKDIPLLSSEDGKALGRVTWDAVLLDSAPEEEGPFTKVSYGEIKDAYVATAKLRSPIDYRLIMSSRNGKWSITAFIAGD